MNGWEEGRSLQKPRLNTPPRNTWVIDHKRCAETEHNTDEVRAREGPGCSAGAQALGWDLGGIGVANC
jgi:hypothetical protein